MSRYQKSVISKNLIFLNSDLNQQQDILHYIAEKAERFKYVSSSEALLASIEEREAEFSTAIGYGIAMPHAKTTAINTPFIAFLRTQTPFQWSDQNQEKVNLIFLIGVPKNKEQTYHLKFISELSKKLLDENYRENLLNLQELQKVFEELSLIKI